jgi:large subunit ribosomal protein L29
MKQSEVIKLSKDELQERLNQLKSSYNNLKATHTISPIQNPLQIRFMRRAIARINSELHNRLT